MNPPLDEGWPELDEAIHDLILRKRRNHLDKAVALGIIDKLQAAKLYALFLNEVRDAESTWRDTATS